MDHLLKRETERVSLRLALYRQSVRLGAEPLETHGQNFFSQLNTCGHSPYITSSLMRGWVCHLQLLLVLASAFILVSESRGSRDHVLLSQIRDPLFVASYDSQGYGGGIRPSLHTGSLLKTIVGPRYTISERTAQKTFLPLLRILSLPGEKHFPRAGP
jgi:hypothetical protein